ncbi:hypothetical protein Tco_0005461 [Tanacetum coccineum]
MMLTKLVNALRVKKLEKSHDPLAWCTYGNPLPELQHLTYVNNPSSVVDYDDDYQGYDVQNNFEDPLTSVMILLAHAITQCFSNLTNNHLRTSSNTKNKEIVQVRTANVNVYNLAVRKVIMLVYCPKIQPANFDSDEGPSYDSALLNEVQTSTSYVNPLFAKDTQEQKTQTQTQGEINELFENVKQKTYAYADVRAQNQDLLITISELKAKLENVEKISPNKQQAVETNKNVITPGMYKVEKTQNKNTNKAKRMLSSTGLRATSSVRIPSNRDSLFKNSVLSNTKNSSEKVEVSDRSNKKSDVALKDVDSNKKQMRALFTTSRIVKSKFKDPTSVVLKTRFSVKTVQSKSLDTTPVVSKTEIAAVTPLCAKNKVFSAFNLRDSSLSNYMKNKI